MAKRILETAAAVLKGRCPHCRQGDVFGGPLRMHTHCPVCGIDYERESGFFAMSIFIGYLLVGVVVVPILGLLYWLGVNAIWYYTVPTSAVILLSPFIFRYARVLWLHLDEWMDPRPKAPPRT